MAIQRKAAASSTPEAPTEEWSPVVRGEKADIVILCDSPSPEAAKNGLPCAWEDMSLLSQEAKEFGFKRGDIAWVSLSTTIPKHDIGSAARKWAHVQPFVPKVMETVRSLEPKVIVTMGELASRAVLGRAVKITKARGIPVEKDGFIVLPFFAPGYVRRIPDNLPAFQADLNTLARIREAGFDLEAIGGNIEKDYRWVLDPDEVRDQIGKVVSIDTETTGLIWHNDHVRVLTVQFSPRPGVSWCFPVDKEYCEKWFTGSGLPGHGPLITEEQRLRLVGWIKEVLEDGTIRKIGYNIKFDHVMLRKMGIHVQGWLHDGQLQGFCVDENMLRKDLGEYVRVFVPEMAGYDDEFNRTTNKNDMLNVPPFNVYADGADSSGGDALPEPGAGDATSAGPEEGQAGVQHRVVVHGMLDYAGGDTDATYRLCRVLDAKLRHDTRQLNCYRKIMIPAMMVFANSVERYGMRIDVEAVREIEAQLKEYIRSKYRQLIRLVPAAVRRKHLKGGLSFTRPSFMQDVLFSKEGFNLTPTLFTDGTKDLPREKQVPQTGKDHLTYFVNDERPHVATFCSELIAYGAAQKMLSTYVGEYEYQSGIHQYIASDGNIYPSYMLHRTVTGRTASASPNGQNFPKRSPKNGPDWATMFQGIFLARPGWKLVNCDLSQIELRLVAWMSGDRTMLQIYREGGDIHTKTAKYVLGISDEQWDQYSKAEKKDFRFKAKAVNFGFVYGMSAAGFQVFAKTDYGLDFTLEEAEEIRRKYFELYSGLPAWHEMMKSFVGQYRYVRAMHGAVRHCPGIKSTDAAIRSGVERQAINSPIQRFGSDLGLMAMIRFASQMDPNNFRIIGFVHDALVLECREGFEQEGASYLKWVMETTPLERWFGIKSPIPILAEVDIASGESSATLEEIEGHPAIKPPNWNDDEDEMIRQFMLSNPWEQEEEHMHMTV